uniref:Cytochrome b n=1 Tax=Sinentomon erythranum TaxID=289455 RepID=G3D5N9_9HEXA|nr:cytochrome b [Sinentomon erythranum]ADN32966.1 cytochrome b [Sinentomon erythranum]
MFSFRKYYLFLSSFNSFLFDLPSPSSISYFWNFGSLLGFFFFSQILTGIFISMHYSGDVLLSFMGVVDMSRNVFYGWGIRSFHSNGASFFFFCLYFHLGRGLYYESYGFFSVWSVGVVIFLLSMMIAFLGYVLPWGQMSFWGATAITSLVSVIPYLGEFIVSWLWGGFSIDNATLNRFYTLHFLVPFILLLFVFVHLVFLHDLGSSNPLGVGFNIDSVSFHPYYVLKDLFGVFVFFLFFFISVYFSFFFMDPDNFIPANSLVTPVHIQPEWYLLFAYAILRSIPSKLGGVFSLVFVFFLLVPMFNGFSFSVNYYSFYVSFLFWILVGVFFILTWIGMNPAEYPYIFVGQLFSFFYYFLVLFKIYY